MRGDPIKLELSSGGQAPCSTGFPCSVSVLGTHLYQGTSWCCCERLSSASVDFFVLKTLSMHLSVSWWVIYEHTCLQFLTKNGVTTGPHPPCSPSLAPVTFFLFSRVKKVLKGKGFADVEEVKQKRAEAQKGLKTSSKTALSSGKMSW